MKEKEEGGVVIWKQREVLSVWYTRIKVSGTHLSWEIDRYYRRIVWGRCLISQFCPCGCYHSQGPDSWEVWPHSLPSLTLWCYPMWYKDWNETERQMPNLTICFYDRYHSHRPDCRERSLCNHIVCPTLWAPLSGTFLQTLPDLVMPSGFSYAIKGHSFYLRTAVHQRGQLPPKGSGTKYDCRSSLVPKHACKHETHPPRVKKRRKEFCLDSNDFGFICAGVNFVGSCKRHALFYFNCL